MNFFATASVFLLFLSVALPVRANEEIEVDTAGCPVKSAQGDFSYDMTLPNNPTRWGDIKEDFATCKEGEKQSPINFPANVQYAPKSAGPKSQMSLANMTFGASSYNWAMSCSDESGSCGKTSFAGKTYELINVHFHSPSEHKLFGKEYPLECHMVHAAEDGSLAVVGMMFEYAEQTSYPARIYQNVVEEYGDNVVFSTILGGVKSDRGEWAVPVGQLVNHNKGYCSYSGSLTTPPCTESVTWFMSMNIWTVSERQVHDYVRTVGTSIEGNHRPVQPLNERPVTCYVS
ncbi:Alpha carbonic anhydrase 1, chloroplastic [Gracilariopsis chorda]|uniref:carbonic anhydrase n=1 Tax=Gracilariopsis chorda TaxID=448386 RepID=A0A2V3IMZ0_9FLOR|nr:Alpha carbonic anhydrase 1, chloroplastic [Gracilariopsis chorda]|eukprot:PXF43446.1 Alpha carbonic anhydrase 1, chloroplastic [Gracilariopsis chorda]